MAVIPQVERPRVETEIKIGNTYYRVNGFFASQEYKCHKTGNGDCRIGGYDEQAVK